MIGLQATRPLMFGRVAKLCCNNRAMHLSSFFVAISSKWHVRQPKEAKSFHEKAGCVKS